MKVLLQLAYIFLFCVPLVLSACRDGSSATKRNNKQCSWYNDKTCCDLSSKEQSGENLECDLSQNCLDKLNLYSCAICSPSYTDWQAKNGSLQICKTFSDDIYNACKDSEYLSDSKCLTVGDKFKSSKDFVEKFFVDASYVNSNKDCFNGASNLAFSWGLLIIGIILQLQ